MEDDREMLKGIWLALLDAVSNVGVMLKGFVLGFPFIGSFKGNIFISVVGYAIGGFDAAVPIYCDLHHPCGR